MKQSKDKVKLDDNSADKDKSIVKILEWVYKKTLNPELRGVQSAYELAQQYSLKKGSLKQQCEALILSQKLKSASSGFMLGLGGIITLPATIPADFTSTLFIQIRMIVAIALLGKYDEHDPRVKILVYTCLSDTVEQELVNEIKDGLVSSAVQQGATTVIRDVAIKHGSKEALRSAQSAAAYKIASHMGSKGVSHIAKVIPFLGGIIGGTFNTFSTNKVGKRAKSTFIDNDEADASISKETLSVEPNL